MCLYFLIRGLSKNKVNKIRLLNEESDLEVTSDMINAYKTNSAKKRVTKKEIQKRDTKRDTKKEIQKKRYKKEIQKRDTKK